MPAAEVGLAKLSKPRVRNVLARERLFASLDRLREYPVVWIAAEPGAGKTTLLSSYLDARRMPSIWYHVDGGDADPASFFYHLGLAAQSLRRRKGAATPLPLLTPEYRADLPGFSRRYFREIYGRLGPGGALVLDNLHEVAENSPLHRALAVGFEEAPEGVGTLIASRGDPPGAYTPLITRNRFALVDPGEIRLTLEETEDIVLERTELDSAAVRRLHEHSGGWAAGLTLLVERARRGEPLDDGHASGTLQPVFAFFAEELLAQDFHGDLDTLLAIAYLPRVTAEQAQALSGSAQAGALLERLHRRHLFTQRRASGAQASYELHALFRAYLQQKAVEHWSVERRHATLAHAARLVEAQGSPEDAVALYRQLGDAGGVARVAVKSARTLIAQGRQQTLLDWIAPLPDALKDAQPLARYWQGVAMTAGAPRDARVELVRAYAGFVANGEALGRVLAAAGVVYTYYLDLAQLQELDPWIAEIQGALDAGARFPTPAMELHVRAALTFAYAFRQARAAPLEACASRLLALMEEPGIGVNEKVSAGAILLFNYYHRANQEPGDRLMALIAPLLDSPGLPHAARALWLMQVGWALNTRGDLAGAFRALEASAKLCADHGLSIPILDVYVQFGCALTCICAGDLARAESHLARAEAHWKSFRTVDVSAGAMAKGVIAQHRGDKSAAREHAAQHLELAMDTGVPWQIYNAMQHNAIVGHEQGRHEEARAHTQRAREFVTGWVHERFLYQADLVDAYGHLLSGERDQLRAKLAAGLAAGRNDPAKFFLRLQPRILPRLFAAALAEDIEVDSVRRNIHELKIAPPEADTPDWPWPLAIATLGRFEVRREGRPLEFSRKAPRKTLQLLKAIIALGGRQVREQALLDALWPDEEGDAASKSLGAAVLRLRTLLGDPESVVQQGGTLSLERSRVWVDAWAFEQSLRLDLYAGTFLPEEEGEPWAVPLRERLRARFIHQVGEHGSKLERDARHAEAIDWYLRGLDADSIVEPFYQGLMRCYDRLDRRAEAAATYRRLKQILSVTLGLPPSATTERLYRDIAGRIPNP